MLRCARSSSSPCRNDSISRVAIEQRAAILTVTHDEKIFGDFDRIFHLRDDRLASTEGATNLSV